jgi:hypothetical protein
MGQVVHLTQPLTTLTCWAKDGCGIQFAVPQAFYQACCEHGTTFFCPRGHRLSIGESAVDRLTRERDQALKKKEWAEEGERKARHAEAIAKGKLKAQSKRVKAGVCPCCKRYFKQLASHMECKHPEWEGVR